MAHYHNRSKALHTALGITAACLASQLTAAELTEPSATVRIDPSATHQTIRGFGASGAWYEDDYMRFPQADRRAFTDFLFDQESGLGLKIYRTRVYPKAMGGETKKAFDWEDKDLIAIAQFCKEIDDRYDLTLKAVPWTPPAWMKDNQSRKGGRLLPEFYPDYADYLTTYLIGMRERFGVEFDVLSIQNEADSKKTWDSCIWTPEEMTIFTRDHLVPAMKAAGLEHVQLMVNEQTAWTDRAINKILEDPVLAEAIDIAAAHLYWGGHKPESNQAFEKAESLGLDVWMTEFYYGDYLIRKGRHDDEIALAGKDEIAFTPIDRTLALASIQNDSLTQANVNAWLFWWAMSPSNKPVEALITANERYESTEAAITTGWTANKWAYGLGQFSKFIRPGFQRIQAESSSQPEGVLASAYAGPSGELVTVLINQSDTEQTLQLQLDQQPGIQWQAYRTSETEDLAEVSAPKSTADHTWQLTLPARSITTLTNQ